MSKDLVRKIPIAFALISTLLISACGGGGGSGDGSSFNTQGTLRVALTDSPACGFDEVNVTVSTIRVHQSATAAPTDVGWSDITVIPAQKINLLNLTNGVLSTLGQTALPQGRYQQLRLLLVSNATTPLANSVKPSGGVETALSTPSSISDGVKLATAFDVSTGQTVDLVLDFDACKSVVAAGSGTFALRPVITVVAKLTSGGITGFVDTSLLGNAPVVSAQIGGVVVKSTVPDPVTGAFTLSPLLQSSSNGNYDVVFTTTGRAAAVITGVPVTAGTNVVVSGSGGSTPPITLAVSTTHIVSGTVTPLSAEGRVRAFQSLVPSVATTITLNEQAANLTTGAYAFVLPTAAPFWGQYGAGTLPIAFSQTSVQVADEYRIEASAVGFQTETRLVNVTTADVVGNNYALTP